MLLKQPLQKMPVLSRSCLLHSHWFSSCIEKVDGEVSLLVRIQVTTHAVLRDFFSLTSYSSQGYYYFIYLFRISNKQ